jgi:hypothetical protein
MLEPFLLLSKRQTFSEQTPTGVYLIVVLIPRVAAAIANELMRA